MYLVSSASKHSIPAVCAREISDEKFSYDRDGEGQISCLTTSVDADGASTTEAAMRQPSAGISEKPLACASFFPYPDQVVGSAWEGHGDCLCVPHEMAEVPWRNGGALSSIFEPNAWPNQGIAPEDIKQLCRLHGHSFYFCHSFKIVHAYEPAKIKGKSIAFCAYNGHCNMQNPFQMISQWKPCNEESRDEHTVFQNNSKTLLPPVWEWQIYDGHDGEPAPVFFNTFDEQHTRKLLLESGKCLKITLKNNDIGGNSTDTSSLRYRCVKAVDGASSICVIRELPHQKKEIEVWGPHTTPAIL